MESVAENLGVQTVEEHFYIRFPPDLSESIREDLKDVRKPSDLTIRFATARTASVQISADEELPAVLVDLPACTETLKSLDIHSTGQPCTSGTSGQYCKVADAAQMLVVLGSAEQADAFAAQMRAADWQYPDGMTAPMVRARQRRFRDDPSRTKRSDLEAIEAQVKRLLEADERALRTRFDYHINARLVKSSDPNSVVDDSSLPIDDEDELEAEFAAEIEQQFESADEEQEEGVAASRLRELGEKRAQLQRVTNPTIRALLEETIRQMESELQ